MTGKIRVDMLVKLGKKKSCLCVNWESNPELNLTRGVEGLNVTATPLTLVVESFSLSLVYIEHKCFLHFLSHIQVSLMLTLENGSFHIIPHDLGLVRTSCFESATILGSSAVI